MRRLNPENRENAESKLLKDINSHIAEADLFGVLGVSDDDTRRSIRHEAAKIPPPLIEDYIPGSSTRTDMRSCA